MDSIWDWASEHPEPIFLIIMAIFGGVVWLSRLQSKTGEHTRQIRDLELDMSSRQVSRTEIKERLAGLEAKMDILIDNLGKD